MCYIIQLVLKQVGLLINFKYYWSLFKNKISYIKNR